MSAQPGAAPPVQDAAPLFAALGDATRFGLLARLASGGPDSIGRLGARLNAPLAARDRVSRQAITKHLEILSEAGLVTSERRGRERIWRIEARRLAEARRYLDLISRQWDDALGRLKRFVETPD
jgi:DNA-binding transcriptional ArsR family regulator